MGSACKRIGLRCIHIRFINESVRNPNPCSTKWIGIQAHIPSINRPGHNKQLKIPPVPLSLNHLISDMFVVSSYFFTLFSPSPCFSFSLSYPQDLQSYNWNSLSILI